MIEGCVGLRDADGQIGIDPGKRAPRSRTPLRGSVCADAAPRGWAYTVHTASGCARSPRIH